MKRYIPREVRIKFLAHRDRAKYRNSPFLLTLEGWWGIWRESGHWHESGKRRGQYQMARYGDQGGYEVGNVRICTVEENFAEKVPWFKGRKFTPEYRAKINAAVSVSNTRRWADPEFRARIRAKISAAQTLRWSLRRASSGGLITAWIM